MTRLLIFIMTPLALLFFQCRASAGVLIAYDFVDHFADSTVTNALSAAPGSSTAGGVKMRDIFLHPTNKEATALYNIALPKIGKGDQLVLTFSAGIRDGVPMNDPAHPFDGVKFTLRIDDKGVFTTSLAETKWVSDAVDLAAYAGKKIKIVFATDCIKNSNYDWAVWGEPRILKLSNSVLPKGRMETQTAKGLVVVRYIGTNSVHISPSDLPKTHADPNEIAAFVNSHSVTWSSKGDFGPQQLAVIPFDFTALGARGIRLAMTDLIGPVEVYEYDPQLEIASFGPVKALALADSPTTMSCVINNTGEGVLHQSADAIATITGMPGATQSLGEINPGAEKTITWTDITLPTGTAKASVAVTGQGIKKLTAEWAGEVVKAPAAMPAEVDKPEAVRLADGAVLLQKPGLRMAFLNGTNGFAGWIAYILEDGNWKPAASGSMSKVVDVSRDTHMIYPKDARLINLPGKPPMVRFTADKLIGKAPCHFEWLYSMTDNGVDMTHTMKTSAPLDIRHFSGPMVYAGDLGFGKTKDEGLFPGLEYLNAESSSGVENAHPPFNLRTVPHPNKVTIPLMAVRKGGLLLSLEWDPLQKWDGANDRPSAIFASPNFIDGQDNHKMGLFAPSIPKWVTENQQIAAKPYTLIAGKTLKLTAKLMVRTGSKSVIDAVDGWIARHKLPDLPQPQTTTEGWLNLCDEAYFGGAWDNKAKAWKHTNTGPTSFDPMIANYLWNRANYYLDPKPQKRLMNLVGPAIEKAKDNLPLEVALLNGDVESALNRMKNRVAASIAVQTDDGSFPFQPDKAHEVFGIPGDTSSGSTAMRSLEILQYALVTGDKTAREAGLKALEYLDSQSRPEGAQTWELQLHVPDILASSKLVDAYLYGYQLTDDPKYLQRAVYWAKTGLPFVYMWNAPDRPVMRYGTIPVYGVTWFNGQPWFGIIVQWCGLDYASALVRLSYFDTSVPWMKIADGILRCAVQQQEYIKKKYPADAGMYPDAFNAMSGEEAYHWDLNPRYISKVAMQVFGADGFPRSASITDTNGNRLTLTAPANIVTLKLEGKTLRARIVEAPKATLYMLLSGVHEPIGVGFSDTDLNGYADLAPRNEGFRYIPDHALTVLKIHSKPEMNLSVDLTDHLQYRPPTPDVEKTPLTK